MDHHIPITRIRPGPWIPTILLLVLFQPIFTQQREIAGEVTNIKTGEPLPGVSIVVPGTTIGTSTDVDGSYHITVTEGTMRLMYSHLGMRTVEVLLENRSLINIQLEPDVLGLDEVVITALGVTREKKSLGYSVQDIDGEEIETAREKNIVNSLQGRLAGVQITNGSGSVSSGSRILIRGNSTLQGNNQPLFIVDGITVMNSYTPLGSKGGIDYGNTAMDLNPSDIESISILKGANAAALYGSRAVNGVVLITTKSSKFKPGQRSGISVTLESNFMWDRPLILPEFQDLYGQGLEGQFIYVDGLYGGKNDGSDESWGPPLDYIVQTEDLQPGGKLYWTIEKGIPQTIGQTLVLPQFDSPYDPVTDVRTSTPWISHPDNVKNVFETGLTATNTLTLSGAGETANFRLSVGNQYLEGIIPNTDLKKNNITISSGLNISSKFRVEVKASYINNRSDNIMSGGYVSKNILNSLSQWFGRQVDVVSLKAKWDEPDPKTGLPFNWNHSYHDNPYFVLNKNVNSRNRDRFMGNVNAEYRFANYLSFTGTVGNDWYTEERKVLFAKGTVEDPNGRFDAYMSKRNQLTARGQLNFNKNFGDLSIIATGGGEYSRYNYQSNDTHVKELIVPDLYAVSNAAVAATTDMREEHTELQSVFGMVNLGFKNYLFLDLTARNDWSSTLPAENNSYFYPSVSLGFILTEALGMQSDILSYLKFRASYAEVGGSATAYQIKGVYNANDPFNGNPALTYTDTRPPLNLKPQKKKSVELGTEIKLISNRLGLDVTWYKENTINQIMNIVITGTSGFQNQTINAGNLKNQGWELTCWASPLRTSSLTWDISMNWARNVNKVVDLYEGIRYQALYPMMWGEVMVLARVGESYGQMWGLDIVREHATPHYYDEDETLLDYIEYSGRPVVTTSGNYTQASQRSVIGNIMPDWFGGVNNAFSFKNFNLSFLVDFRKGGDHYSATHLLGRVTGIFPETASFNANGKNIRDPISEGGGVLIENGVYGKVDTDGSIQFTDRDGNDVDEPVENNTYIDAQTFYEYPNGFSPSVFDASFVKLREVILGYNFYNVTPWISNIKLSLVGRNLWLIHSNMPYVDPENAFSAGSNSVGVDSNPIPSTRSMGFNVKITF